MAAGAGWQGRPLSRLIHRTVLCDSFAVMTYVCPAWELAADTHLLKVQRLQNKVLYTMGNFPRRTPVRDLHTNFNFPYAYDCITKLCRQQT
jgi:hypothetical protein